MKKTAIFAYFVWLCSAALAQAGNAQDGRAAFNQKCGGCHSLNDTINHYAPNLACIIGRPAASANFPSYSQDFVDVMSGFTWSEEALLDYLANQREFLTKRFDRPDAQIMMNLEWPDETFRRDVIAYLKSRCTE